MSFLFRMSVAVGYHSLAQLFFNTILSEFAFSVCTIIHALSTIEEIQIFALALVKCFAI